MVSAAESFAVLLIGSAKGENIHLNDCRGCIVHAPGASSVVLQGLEDCIVVERDGRLLICKLSEEQRIKDFEK